MLFMFNTIYFVSLPVGPVKPKNNLPEAISASLGQALISNPAHTKKNTLQKQAVQKALIFGIQALFE